jgi:hypothetical protein
MHGDGFRSGGVRRFRHPTPTGDTMNDTYQASSVTPSFPLSPEGEAPYFRREFFLERQPERALLRVTALGIVEPHPDGSHVGEEVLAPGWTSYRHRLPVSTHDVTPLLGPGANALGAIVGDGWAVGRIRYPSPVQDSARCHYADRPALFLQLEPRYADGTAQLPGTDKSFSRATGTVLAPGLYDDGTLDARLEPVGWSEPGFDDRTVTGGPVRLGPTGRAGQTVTLRHAEILTDGELDTTSLRSAKSVDRYVLRGGGAEVWEPAFTLHGFRCAGLVQPLRPGSRDRLAAPERRWSPADRARLPQDVHRPASRPGSVPRLDAPPHPARRGPGRLAGHRLGRDRRGHRGARHRGHGHASAPPRSTAATVTAGTRNWTYPAPPGQDPHVRYTLDAPLHVLVSDDGSGKR